MLLSVYLTSLFAQTFHYNVRRCHLARASFRFPKPPECKSVRRLYHMHFFLLVRWGKDRREKEEASCWEGDRYMAVERAYELVNRTVKQKSHFLITQVKLLVNIGHASAIQGIIHTYSNSLGNTTQILNSMEMCFPFLRATCRPDFSPSVRPKRTCLRLSHTHSVWADEPRSLPRPRC